MFGGATKASAKVGIGISVGPRAEACVARASRSRDIWFGDAGPRAKHPKAGLL